MHFSILCVIIQYVLLLTAPVFASKSGYCKRLLSVRKLRVFASSLRLLEEICEAEPDVGEYSLSLSLQGFVFATNVPYPPLGELCQINHGDSIL